VTEPPPSAPPTGFWIALPDGWVSLDVDPRTSQESARKLAEGAAGRSEVGEAERAAIERLLVQLSQDAAASGVRFCACYFDLVEDQLPVQASLTVAFHTIDTPNDPAGMLNDLEGPGRRLELVELDGGTAVRGSGRRCEAVPGTEETVEFLSCQFYIRLPGTTDQIALLTFASPTVVLEEDLLALFDSMAKSFAFTW
jgi:hypothetical protein